MSLRSLCLSPSLPLPPYTCIHSESVAVSVTTHAALADSGVRFGLVRPQPRACRCAHHVAGVPIVQLARLVAAYDEYYK